jgi:UPF0755 protein
LGKEDDDPRPMKYDQKHITITDWIVLFVSTFLIFLSSILLIVSGIVFALFRSARRRPVLTVASLIVIFVLYVVIQWMLVPVTWRAEEESAHVTIEQGDSMTRIIGRLEEAKVIEDGTELLILAKLSGKDREIQAGRYSFEKGTTLYSIFSKLIRGDVTLREVTIPEGLTIRQIAGVLSRQIEIDSLEFVRLTADKRFTRSMGIAASNLEGYLFPDTYRLSWDTTPEKVVRVMVEQFKKTFDDSLMRRGEEISFSLPQVVTLASMIEAEAKDGNERDLISAVYHNRLRRGMLLQCDPTVIYALPELNRPLLLKDLEVDSPYNTYRYPGLPPGPICNPGKASILAALYPADVNYLYFVATGEGSHIFSATLAQHNLARAKVKRGRRN